MHASLVAERFARWAWRARGGRGDIKREFRKQAKQSINAKKVSRPNVADWQYLGVDKITRILEWNSGRKARKGHICEDSY